MKLVTISTIFEVKYGVNLELNKLILDPNGVNFVSRSQRNNGVSAKVKKIEDVEPLDAGLITVAGGGSVLETFLQTEPFYSGRDLYYLKVKDEYTLNVPQKLFYCMCIKMNKYRYSYGRQANRTLKDLLIPDLSEVPIWIKSDFENIVENWKTKLCNL